MLGSYYHFVNNFEKSLEAFNTALKLFQEIDQEDMVIKINNNFGVIYLDELGDYLKARDYFRRAYNRANTKNYYVSTPIYLNNLGETYRIEGRFTTAIKYFEESYTLSENIGDKNMVILSLLNLSYVYLMKEKYGKTHTLINRLEHEINAIKNKEFDKFDYYMLHFEYFISMNSIMKVEKWRYEFDADEILDDFRRFRIKIIDLVIQYRKSLIVYSSRTIPYAEIQGLKDLVSNPAEAMLLRNFIIDIMIDYVDDNQFLEIEELITIDNTLVGQYNTKHIQIKRSFVDACMVENSFEGIHFLLPELKEESQELLWRAYKYLGDEEFHVKKNYSALKFYLMSLDIIANLTHDIVVEFKETYILYDNAKMTLKNRINKIVKIFLSFETSG
ncbi:MAG: diguanylate cyclase, partial [uncultured bacterium (gcode 4)]